ncbi:MAG: MjaI family restriction endonuclease [Thermodesulfovibrionales bacterium]|nr:MjaI family restriction endonuclease [Thermodesulfovibrionales bacterium]
MSKLKIKKVAKAFGKKEKVLNYTSNTYHLTRPKKVDAVMALMRECQPKTFEEWESFYFEKAFTKTKTPIKVTKEILTELGIRLYEKITQVVVPEWTEAFSQITLQDCIDFVYEVTIHRTYDGFIREKSVVNDYLAKKFPAIKFEESDPELDHAGDIDYLGWVGERAFGIQIKPITAQSSFGNYSVSERMKASFEEFTERFCGKGFIIFCEEKKIKNEEVLRAIEAEVARLKLR